MGMAPALAFPRGEPRSCNGFEFFGGLFPTRLFLAFDHKVCELRHLFLTGQSRDMPGHPCLLIMIPPCAVGSAFKNGFDLAQRKLPKQFIRLPSLNP